MIKAGYLGNQTKSFIFLLIYFKANFIDVNDPKFVSQFKEPCVVFTGHPSLRFGPVVHFMKMWSSNAKNSILFIDPDFDHTSALGPYQSSLQMRVFYCPIDPRFTYAESSILLKELKPKHIVIPQQYAPSITGK